MCDDDDDNIVDPADAVEACFAIVTPSVLGSDDDIVKNPAGLIETQTMLCNICRVLFGIPFEENCSHNCIYRQ